MKTTSNTSNKIEMISKINFLKINSNKLSTKKLSKNTITPRQTHIIKNLINTNSNKKIKVNMLTNNEENINNNHQNQNHLINKSKSKGKIKNEAVTKKKNFIKKVLTVNKSYHTIAKNKNKKNDMKNYNSLINTLISSQNDNKGYMTTSSTNNNFNNDIHSTKREKRSKSKTIQKKKTIDNIKDVKAFPNGKNFKLNNKNNGEGASLTNKNCIKKTKSNSNIQINLNNNFNNIINKKNLHTIKDINYLNINNKNEISKDTDKFNKSGEYFNLNRERIEKKNSEKNLKIKTKKTINNIRNESLNGLTGINKKKRTSKSSKKLTIKKMPKSNIVEESTNNKSTCTINNSKTKINMGRPSVNELLYNSINNTKSIQILSPIKPKPKKNLNKNKNSINLLESYNIKKNNMLNYKNNNNNINNLKKKKSALLNNKKSKINNQNKKNKKLINNNIIETNNTTGTLGTIFMNKEDTNLSKGLGSDINKSIKNKSFKNFQSNPIINITDSIQSKNKENNSHYININNNNIIKITNKKSGIKKEIKELNDINMKNNGEELESIDNNTINKNKDNKDSNEPINNNTDNYYKLLDISPNPPSSYNKKHSMSKKNKSVSHIHIPKKGEKDEKEEIIKKSPLSKKSLIHPKLNDKIIIKFEDLLEFETKLDNIITSLSNNDNINEGGASNECTEFMSFYFHSSLCGIFINFFGSNNKIIIHSGNNLLLLSVIITYHLSINPKMLYNLVDDMKYIFSLLKINYLLLIKKIEIYYDEDFPIKYVDILNQKLGQVKTTNCSNEIDIISKINKNCCNISERIKLILNHYQRSNDKSYNEFNGIFKNISTVSENNINNYFYNYLYINPFDFENNKINNISNINDNYNKNLGNGSTKNFPHMDSSISSISNTSIKGYDDIDSDNFYNDNMSYKTEKSSDNEREILSVKSYKSSNYYGKIKANNLGSTINCDNNFYYNIENNIYENDEDGTNAYEIMQMLKDYEINKVDPPFLVAPCKKKYTLVLDLDETLIHLRQKKDIINIKNDVNIKINNTSDYFYDNYDKNNNKYLLQFRVGLFSFLTILKPFYEIISFTSATREYADVIIDEIEKNRKFFDHKFYREHTVIYKDTFVKDISRIGRDIKKIIIVDNNESNFILNKDNGIKIAPYYGDEDNNNKGINNSINSENNGRLSYRGKKGNDNILLELKKILVMIYKDNYDDLREALKDYEDLIKTKVSMNL